MPRVFRCVRTDGAVAIDGQMSEPAWQKAPVVSDFVAWDSAGKLRPAFSQTRVRAMWDDAHLYIGAELDDRDIYAMKTEPQSTTWDDDVFEVFLKPRRDLPHYYEFHVTPRNVTLELFIPRRRCGSIERFYFSSGMRSAVTLRGTLNDWRDIDEGWTVEMAIPFAAFRQTAGAPQVGDEWQVAFCRYDYSYHLPPELPDGVECSTSARLSVRSFHRHEEYDTLVFEE